MSSCNPHASHRNFCALPAPTLSFDGKQKRIEADFKRAYSLADTLLAEREKRQELEAEFEAEVDAIIG